MMKRKEKPSIDLTRYQIPYVGGTLNFNHVDCPAGVDIKQRLYLTTKPLGVLWYCHNCGQGGFSKQLTMGGIAPPSIVEDKELNNGYDEFHSIHIDPGHKYPSSIYREDSEYLYNAAWESYDVYTGNCKDWIGYQKRSKFNIPPKYKWVKDPNKCAASFIYYSDPITGPWGKIIVIVEDIKSGLAITEGTGMASYVLYGTHFDPVDFYRHYKGRDTMFIAVWLDNDNDIVLNHALSIQSKVRTFHNDVRLVDSSTKDPKHYSSEQITKVIANAR